MRKLVLAVLLLGACATATYIRTVKRFSAARQRGDDAAADVYLAPDARIWFEKKSGPGFVFGHGREQ